MTITATGPLDLSEVLAGEPNRDARLHVQIAVWFSAHPRLPRTNIDGLRTLFRDGTEAQNTAAVNEVARYLGVEATCGGGIYTARCEIVPGVWYEAYCTTTCFRTGLHTDAPQEDAA